MNDGPTYIYEKLGYLGKYVILFYTIQSKIILSHTFNITQTTHIIRILKNIRIHLFFVEKY